MNADERRSGEGVNHEWTRMNTNEKRQGSSSYSCSFVSIRGSHSSHLHLRSSAAGFGALLNELVRHIENELEQCLSERLALRVDAEVGAAAAVEDVGEDEVERAEVRQLVA